MENGNGKPATTATLTLTLDLLTYHLDIKGEGPSNDCFMAMLAQAQRYFDAQNRLQLAAHFQQQAREQAENAKIAALVRGKA